MEKIMQWSKGALIGAVPSTHIRMKTDSWVGMHEVPYFVSMAGSQDEWKLLCVVQGYDVYKNAWDPYLEDEFTTKH